MFHNHIAQLAILLSLYTNGSIATVLNQFEVTVHYELTVQINLVMAL